MDFVWEKPVVVFYKERREKSERKAFAVVRARKLIVSRYGKDDQFKGSIEDFFPLMGDIDSISSKEGVSDRYVLCWFDDKEKAFNEPSRLTGVTFSEGLSFITDKKGKRSYNGSFRAEQGELE